MPPEHEVRGSNPLGRMTEGRKRKAPFGSPSGAFFHAPERVDVLLVRPDASLRGSKSALLVREGSEDGRSPPELNPLGRMGRPGSQRGPGLPPFGSIRTSDRTRAVPTASDLSPTPHDPQPPPRGPPRRRIRTPPPRDRPASIRGRRESHRATGSWATSPARSRYSAHRHLPARRSGHRGR